MTVEEIFDTLAIREIEDEMIRLEEKIERSGWSAPGGVDTMHTLIVIRHKLLAEMFVMDVHYKKLLSEFNEALKQQLIQMREETIKAVQSVKNAGVMGDIQGVGKCFLGYRYSKLHPIQTERAKKIWAILNGTIDDYLVRYEEGVYGYSYDASREPESKNEMLYLAEAKDNWNDDLDQEMTKDMLLIYPVHNLIGHIGFSIFDVLWVRDFNVEIHIETDYNTYPENEEEEDITFD